MRIRWLAGLTVAALMLSACGGGSNAGSSGSAASGPADRSATLRYAYVAVPADLDPYGPAGDGINTATFVFPIYDRLMMIGSAQDPTSTAISPMLAASWEYSQDGLTFTVHLRDDVKFHDGTPVNADAVKASIERAKQSTHQPSTLLKNVTSVDVVDEHTAALHLSQPDATLPAALATQAGVVINPKVLSDPSVNLTQPPAAAGSGPYVVGDFQPSVSVTYQRSTDAYWDPDAALIKQLQISAVSETTTRLSGLQAGDYDMIFLASTSVPEGDRLVKSGQFQQQKTNSTTLTGIWLRPTAPSLSNLQVRQAIASAVDRQGIADGALNGTCNPVDQLFVKGTLGYDPNFQNPYPYDPAKASSLLKQAGVSNPSFNVVFSSGSTQQSVTTALQAELATIGVKLDAHAVDPSQSIIAFNQQNFDAAANAIAGTVDPALVTNYALFSALPVAAGDTELQALAAQAAAELDQSKREALYQQINQKVITDALFIPVCAAQFSWVGNNNLVNLNRMGLTWSSGVDFRYVGVSK
jgi:peptide/nickel transport system substrate-binding protein